LNFVSKFDGSLSISGTHPKGQTHVDTVTTKAPADAIVVPDAQLLFNGDFKRSGSDLIISNGDHELRLPDYFKGDKHAPLASPDGAYLTGKIVDALTGHVEVAQAGGSANAVKIIGHVTKLTGSATVVRNGVSIILNNGDNVHQGDVVQTGSSSSLGITFIDGSVFGLASNAKMVLNEMVYDPNGSSNSSLVSLVQGTISFVAGATAKHGDMKVDTPVATMGIRGTAVLVEIEFDVTQPGNAPPARFQVLVEPDGTTGSYVLLDRVTLAPMATINQAGTVTTVSGQGVVSFLASAQLSAEAMKLISEVFSQKYTDNSNPKSDTHFTDSPIPDATFGFKFANGDPGVGIIRVLSTSDSQGSPGTTPTGPPGHVPGKPQVFASEGLIAERDLLTGSSLLDKTSGNINYLAPDAGDIPTARTAFSGFTYKDAQGNDVTATLTAAQKAAIANVSVPLTVVQDPGGKNHGSAAWAYQIPDGAADFLAEGQKLTLSYTAFVDTNFAQANETGTYTFTITLTGTNDTPTIVVEQTTPTGGVVEDSNVIPSGGGSGEAAAGLSGNIATGGTVTFKDVDLTDTHTASFVLKSTDATANLPGFAEGTGAGAAHIGTFALTAISETPADANDNGSLGWTFTLPDSDPTLQSLAEGQTITQIYTITVDDGHTGGKVTQDVTVTITGTNDAPTIVGAATTPTGAVTEDSVAPNASLTADGTITFQDLDLIDTHTAQVAFATSASSAHLPGFIEGSTHIGTLTLDPSVTENNDDISNIGSVGWHFVLPDNDPTLQSLAEGQTITQTYTITVTDNNGAPVTQNVTVTITGANDGPTIEAATTTTTGAVTEDTVVPDASLTADGTITFQDIDLIDTHTASVAFKTSSSNAHLPGFYEGSTNIGTFTLDPSVTENNGDTSSIGSVGWHFTLPDNDPVLQSLANGQTITQTYTVTLKDNNGATVTQDVTITIHGTNDGPNNAPTIVVEQTTATGEVTEDAVAPDASLTADGTITFQDLDLIDTHTATVAFKTSASSAHLPGFSEGSTQIGTLTLDPSVTEDNTDTSNIGSVGWHFVLPDNDPVLQSLAKDQTITQTYTVTVTDNNNATVTQDVTVTITGTNDGPTIEAAATTPTGAVTEDAVAPDASLTADGTITFQDLDLIDTHTATVAFTTSASSAHLPGFTEGSTHIGTLTLDPSVTEDNADTSSIGSLGWHFVLPDNDPVLQSLAKDQTITQTYTVTVTDNNNATVTQDVTVTITGTNDGPTIEAAATTPTGAVTEDAVAPDASLTADGTITFQDLDLIDTHTATVAFTSSSSSAHLPGFIEGSTHIGTLTLDASVTEDNGDTDNLGSVGWHFVLDDSDPMLQSLAEGQTITQVYTVTVTDNNGAPVTQDVTVTITGANDGPTVETATTTLSGDVTEDSQVDQDTNAIATSGNVDFGDLDLTDLHAATFVLKSSDANADLPGFAEGTGAGAAHIGTFALNVTEDNTDTINTGSVGWSFTLDNDNYVLQSLAEDQTITQVYTVTVPDGHGASISKDVTVTIHGTNDDPHAANVALTSAPSGDGWVFDPDNGHYYRYVEESVNFADATSAASNDGAYLATITSAAENTFIANLPGVSSLPYPYGVWTSGATSDANPDGNPSDPSHWSWSGGPETGASFTYTNWHSGEPNGGFSSTDAAMQIGADGTWNDVPSTPSWNAGYVEEWGGRTSDPVTEDQSRGFSTATLLAQATDVDKIDVLTVSAVSATSADGAAVTLSGGTITYDPTHAATLQALAVGETATDTFSYTVSDGHGGTSTATATVNVVGLNDAPVFVAADSASFTEGANATDAATGALSFTDVDASDTHSFAITGVTASGATSGLPDDATLLNWLSLGAKTDSSNGATGSQAWSFSAADTNFDYLADGQQVTLTYAVQMSDGHGGTATHDVTITVTGTNDAPVFTGESLASTSVNGADVAIVSNVAAGDIDSDNYSGGKLTATVTDGGHQGDTLSIDHNQYIELVGTTVMYDADGDGPGSAVTIGTLTNYDYNSLTVTLNGNADDAAVAKLTQAIEFSNSTADPTAGERTVTFTLQDGGGTAHGGHDSAYFTAEVTVSEASNHGPIVENSSWITRVSIDSNDFEGGGDSFAGAVSNAGVAAFSSDADNLVDEDANGDTTDIFIHRLNDGATERVNVSSSGAEANSQTFGGPSISANGNFVVFESAANNLVADDTNDAPDVFVHNVETGATVRVSLDDLDAELPSESMISNHAISDDGRYVVFETQALGAEQDQNHTWDVYVRDLLEGTTELVSARNNSIWPGSGASNYGLISGDGGFVVFNSAVDGLDDNAVDDNGHRDVYIRDLVNHTTTLVSAADDPDFDNSAAYGVSGDGRYVLYTSEVASSGDNVLDLFVRDMQTGEVTLINEDDKSYFTSADISADGRYVVYSAMTPDGYTGVFVYDMTSQITMQVSVAANGNLAEGQSTSEYPAISANGRFITFDSDASNLVDDDGNGFYDAFVVDLAAPARTIHDNGNGQQATFGLLAFTDEDVNDTHTALDVTPWSQAGYVGSFVVESTPSESGGHGTFAWHYQVDHSAIANLADGQTLTQSYLVKISDGTGFTYEAVDVTLVGANDAPVITSDGGGDNASVSVAEDTTAVTTVTATDVDDGSSRSYSVVTGAGSPDAAKFTINPTTGALSFVNAPDYEAPGSAAGSNTYTVQVQVDDGAGGVDVQTLSVNVTDDAEAPVAPALVAQTFLGGSGDQGATDVSYANGHLYLTYNALPVLQQPSDHSTVLSFSTAPDGTPAQDFSYSWTKGFFYGVASDGANIYAVGASHPGSGLTSDGIGGAEDKTLLATFNANGTAGSSPAPATDYAASNFFPGYQGVELFQDVLVTTQGGNTVLYAVGHGQPPTANGGYVIASYDSNDNLLHTATEPVSGGFSIARDVVEFNGQIWAVGYSEHAGPIGRPTAWAANYDLSSVTMYADTAGSAAGDFSGATVIGSNLYAVGYVTSNGNDYLVAKYDTAGNVVWSASFGGTGSDMLTSAVSLNGHLYVVGTTNDGYGHTDGVLMEISTADGSVISTTTYGGALDDAFNSITTDGHYLYVAGESKSFTVAGEDDAILLTYDVSGGPVIDTEHFTTDSAGNNAPTTITGLAVTDSNAAETLTFSAVTAQSGSGSTIMPSSGSGDLSTVNAAINSVVYDPGATPPLTDEITFTVSGPSGSDTVNFVFQQAGNSPNPTLVGGNGKDVVFGTEGSDTLTGGASHDQFVFGPTSGGLVQHTVTDFETPLDKIDLREFDSVHSIGDLTGIQQQGSDTLITIDANDKILLQNVQATSIHASNFLFHV
jgi:VCBS repeat-containing protein